MSATEDLTRKTRVLLVRHGLPAGHLVVDPGLGAVGVEQAHRLAAWLSWDPPAAVVSSPYRRAYETAEIIAERIGHTVQHNRDLREWSSGSPHYVLPEMLADTERGAAFAEGRFDDFVPPHDTGRLRSRMIGVVTQIGRDWPGATVVAVSHGGAINNLLAHIIGGRSVFFVNPGYTSVSQIDVMPSGRLVLVSVNETGHLVGERTVAVPHAEHPGEGAA
jgi:probable phosphoglycerate mutase